MSNNDLNYYTLLDISTDASIEQIQEAYRKKAKEFHPDPNGGHNSATKLFQIINKAREVLMDPAKRLEYDYSQRIKIRPEPSIAVGTRNNAGAKMFGVAVFTLIIGFLLGSVRKK